MQGAIMVPFEEDDRAEYAVLMNRARDAERTSALAYVASGLVASVLLSWGIAGRNAALMLPVLVAVAFGYTAVLRARQAVKLIAGYAEANMEHVGSRPRWFTYLRKLSSFPGFAPSSDWVAASLANTMNLVAVVFSWLYADSKSHGELMAAIVTGCALAFGIYSLSETSRLSRTDFAALWRQVGSEPRDESRRFRTAA
jgi:hypothetical protein